MVDRWKQVPDEKQKKKCTEEATTQDSTDITDGPEKKNQPGTRLLKQRNHNVEASVGIARSNLDPVISVVDAGAGPNLVSMRFLTAEMKRPVKPSIEDDLRSASNTKLKVVRFITLIVQVGNSKVPVQLGAIDDLVTSILLWTEYINKYFRIIAPEKLKLVSNDSTLVEIIAVGVLNEPVTATEQQDAYGLPALSTEMVLNLQKKRSDDQVQPIPEIRSERGIVRAARLITISPWTE